MFDMNFTAIKKPASGIEKIFEFDITNFKNFVLSFTEEDWHEWTVRQNYGNHESTHSIKILWVDLTVDRYDPKNNEYGKIYDKSVELLKPLLNYLENYYGGRIYKMVLARLDPKTEIGTHKDSFFSLQYTHRNHIPVLTNEQVFFGCNKMQENMKEGSVYEIDNLNNHWVRNKSEQHRIHLIVDVIENKTIKESLL